MNKLPEFFRDKEAQKEWADCLHTTKTVGLPHARGHGELYDGVA